MASVDDGQAHVIHVGPDRVAEDDHLQDRQRDDHDERPAIAKDVIHLLAKQSCERAHLTGSGVAVREIMRSQERRRSGVFLFKRDLLTF